MPDQTAEPRPSPASGGARSRRRVWFGIGLLAMAAVGMAAVRSYQLAQQPNVLLITLDTTRADRIGCYGDESASTPTLDALAAEGVLFERAYTPAPLTLPAHASLITGLLPPEHGLITNGRGRLPDDVPTLTETLRRAGYDTAAFVGSFVLHTKFGLNRGFGTYDDDMTHTDPTEHGLHRQRDGSRVVELALNWLDKPRRRPFFCWVHLYDAHHPYLTHADEFGAQFKDRPYDGEIAYVDRQVGKLIRLLEQRQLRQRTLIIVVGDHGESLGEHDEEEHSLTLYDATLRVPWIWTGHGVEAQGRRVAETVSLTDLAPTVLDALGRSPLPGASGRSLKPALSGQAIVGKECYGASDDPLFEHGCAPLRSLATAEWKYIRSTEPELYDLRTDPREMKNLVAEQPERRDELEARLAALEKAMTRRQGADVQLSAQERKALESLGYLGGGAAQESPQENGAPLPDLKRILPLVNTVQQANRLISAGKPVEAETILRQLLADHPDWTEGRLTLADALLAQTKYAECRDLLDAIRAADDDNYKVYFQQGLLYVAQGRQRAAVEQFEQALARKPDAEGVLYNLGLNLLQLGKPAEAQRYFEETLEHDPAYVKAYVGLGMALSAQQSTERAIELYRTALAYDAASVEAHTNLAVLLAGQQRLPEAGEHMAQAAQLAPNNPETRVNYGTYLLTVGKLDDAIAELSAAVELKPNHPQAVERLRNAKTMRQKQR